MSSVEIKIKGIKDIKGLKVKKRGKAQKRKKALIQKKKNAEYSNTMMTPKIIPSYIERPQPIKEPIKEIDYKPLLDRLTNLGTTGLKLYLAQQKTIDNIQSRNIGQPAIIKAPSPAIIKEPSSPVSVSSVMEVMADEEKKKFEEELEKKDKLNLEKDKLNLEALESVALLGAENQDIKDRMEVLMSRKRKKPSSKDNKGNIKHYFKTFNN